MTSHAYLIGGGPGAVDLITVRGLRALQTADVILVDHLAPDVIELLGPDSAAHIIDVSKLPYGKQVAQEKINELIVEHARAGRIVARLKGGDPYVFGRGFEELQACRAAGVECTVIPGVTSAFSVPATAGVPVTHRGATHAVTVVSGHLPPGHPKSLVNWAALAHSGATLSVIMGVKNAPEIAAALLKAGKPADTPAVIIQEGTLSGQRSFSTTLSQLGETMHAQQISAPAVYVIGTVAGLSA